MISLTLMSGAVTAQKTLTRFTKLKLQLQLLVAGWLHFNRVPYHYVFPQGARDGSQVRPCDLMSHYVLMLDPHCTQVHVPDGENLTTRAERVAFVEQVAEQHRSKVFGFGMVFHPTHYRGSEDDPMKEVFEGEMPGFLFEEIKKVAALTSLAKSK